MLSTCDLCERKIINNFLTSCHKCNRIICKSCVGYYFNTPPNCTMMPVCEYCQFSEFSFKVYRNIADLKGTLYVEIGGGKYDGKHWSNGNIFIMDESLGVIAPIINKFIPHFWCGGFYGMDQHLSKLETINMTCYLEDLVREDGKALQQEINLSLGVFHAYKSNIISMINELTKSLDILCEDYETIKFLGI